MSPPTHAEHKTEPARAPRAPDTKANAPLAVDLPVLELKSEDPFGRLPTAIVDQVAASPGHRAEIPVAFGKFAAGKMELRSRGTGERTEYFAKRTSLALTHPLLPRGAAENLEPVLMVSVEKNQLQGRVGLSAEESLPQALHRAPELMGLVGFDFSSKIDFVNRIEAGVLHFGLENVPIKLGTVFDGQVTLVAVDQTVTFAADAAVTVPGLENAQLQLARDPTGKITGNVKARSKEWKQFSGAVDIGWDGRSITGEGQLSYAGEKLQGTVTVRVMDQIEAEKRAAAAQEAPEEEAKPAKKGAPVHYVLFGDGSMTFHFTDWLNGEAKVIVDHLGHVTIIGKITPQKSFTIMEQRDYIKPIFKLEVRAAYGIPVVGDIFLFANIGLDAFAKLGPVVFHNIVVDGTYSTDPKQAQSFGIQGSLNASAAAGMRLRAEGGVGLEILDHDIKAGVGLNGIAGIKAYAEATPRIGYREKAADGEDKKGEFYLRGDLEIAAQPFLGLSGDVFVEIDAPWWSPCPDKKWTWPLFDKEWPLGGSFAALASFDYVFGSGQWPTLDFKPSAFDSEKFLSDMIDDHVAPKSKEAESKGDWKERNDKEAEPPAGGAPGGAAPGKAGDLPTPKAPHVGGGKSGKEADPSASTADGKTVAEHQKKALQDGKKPPGDAGKKPGAVDTKKDGESDAPIPPLPEKKFEAGGESHRLFFERHGDNTEPMMASDPITLRAFLTKAKTNDDIPKDNKTHIPAALKIVDQMDTLSEPPKKGAKKPDPTSKLIALEEQLADLLRKILAEVPVADFDERYSLEGLIGTYGSMPKQTGDRLTPDHQPQASLLLHAASKKAMKGTNIQDVVLGGHVSGGKAINLHHLRHKAGRTYGVALGQGLIDTAVTDNKDEPEKQRKAIVRVLRSELKKDVEEMNTVAGKHGDKEIWEDIHDLGSKADVRKARIAKIAKQIEAGEAKMLDQDLDHLAKS